LGLVKLQTRNAGLQLKQESVLSIESEPKTSDMSAVVKALGEFNAIKAGGEMPHYLLITLRGHAPAEDNGEEGRQVALPPRYFSHYLLTSRFFSIY
jgi:hypothetical protein